MLIFPHDLHNFFQQDMDSYDEKREEGERRERDKKKERQSVCVRERENERAKAHGHILLISYFDSY